MKDKVKIVVNRVGTEHGPDQLEKGPGNDRQQDILAIAQRLSHDGRGAQQWRAADRAGAQGRRSPSRCVQLSEALLGNPETAEDDRGSESRLIALAELLAGQVEISRTRRAVPPSRAAALAP